jgi:hypothetical protein
MSGSDAKSGFFYGWLWRIACVSTEEVKLPLALNVID